MSLPLTTSPAQRPATRRGYATLVVALAAFLASMVVLRVPFRGYLIEARLTGRLSDGLAATAVEQWLKTAAPAVSVRVTADAGGGCQVVMQQIALRADDSRIAIDRVARQFAEQYVPERHEAARQVKLSRLQAELRTARDTEDALRTRAEDLRTTQLAQNSSAVVPGPLAAPHAEPLPSAPPSPARIAADNAQRERLRERRAILLIELVGLLGNFTDQHPKVIMLRSQIAGIERELAASDPALAEAPTSEKHAAHRRQDPVCWITAMQYGGQDSTSAVEEALANLSAATRARQWAERQLQTELETLSSSGGFPWSVESARVLARVGGTPRILTLLAACLVSLVSAALMYWISAALVPRLVIQTTDELAALLALPLVGNAEVAGPRTTRRWRFTPWLAKAGIHGAEIVLVGMFLALAFTMISDRWLAGQVLIDPFGVLSEVSGRLLG